MRECLLCRGRLETSLSFTALIGLKRFGSCICSACYEAFEALNGDGCPCCYKKGYQEACEDCLRWEKQGLDVQHQALFSYNDAMAAYMSQYKFVGDYALREVFASSLKMALKPFGDYQIIPVPVSLERFQERGFNQVTGLLEAAGVGYTDCLMKIEASKQSSKNRQERLQAEQVFALKPGVVLTEKVLVVDDVYTTGATLQLVRQILQEEGVKEIRTLSLAR